MEYLEEILEFYFGHLSDLVHHDLLYLFEEVIFLSNPLGTKSEWFFLWSNFPIHWVVRSVFWNNLHILFARGFDLGSCSICLYQKSISCSFFINK